MSISPRGHLAATVRGLLRARSTILADLERSGPGRLLVRSDRTGTHQLWELDGDRLAPLTDLPEPVASARYVPGGDRAIVAADRGGNERHGLYLLDLEQGRREAIGDLEDLTPLAADPRYVHVEAGVSPDGRRLAYVSNRANGVDFDLWLCDLDTGEHRRLYSPGAWLSPASGFSPDGRWVSVIQPGDRPLDEELVLVDADAGEAHVVLPHPEEAALVGAPAWIDADTLWVSSNVGSDVAGVVRYDVRTGQGRPLADGEPRHDAEVQTSADGRTLLVVENRNGASALTLHDATTGALRDTVELPEPGVVSFYRIPPPRLSADGQRLFFTLTTPRRPADVYAYDRAGSTVTRLTHSPSELRDDALTAPEATTIESFDGETVPLFVYRPKGLERPPAVVLVHGGPEGQAVRAFDPVIHGLLAAGLAVVVPNVRGSTGYGKRYAALDDTVRRLDSVRDLGCIHDALPGLGLDGERAALMGGSYGGYMVLAGLAFQPERWSAGVDIVGISDLVTFLQNTADYRRAHREREYGSLAHDREFLARASPLRRAQDIRAPLFVIHGRNDPRVPVGEAEQLVAGLRERGVRCELLIYEDEGHGLARLENRLDAYPRAIAFLAEVLGA